jgi:D-alanine-D-alanine ligase
VAIVYNAVGPDAAPDEKDVLEQVEAVAIALTELGLTHSRIACTLNLEALCRRLETERPDVVFNLVEALGGSDRLQPVVPALLDTLGVAYTGAPADAIYTTGDKMRAKSELRAAGLPTPAWLGSRPDAALEGCLPGRFILKTLYEHASFGIDDDAVVEVATRAELAELVEHRSRQLGRPCFAEQFIPGREFNLSVLGGAGGPQVLPPAEIDFRALPAGMHRIVGYKAKWDVDSPEYVHTPRRFLAPHEDRLLQERLAALARDAWRLFKLRGWARVDFRVDEQGEPYILEINANPCLSPDAGFAAALEQAGIGFAKAIERILADAMPNPSASAGTEPELARTVKAQ